MESATRFVPVGFEPPLRLVAERFALEPLGPRHNVADHAAWSSSIAHIRGTPGFEGSEWPYVMRLEENLRDLEMHARDFEQRSGFTYTVLDPEEADVIGCVYIYPVAVAVAVDAADADHGTDVIAHDASVRSWVRADRAGLDEPLWRTVSDWLQAEWPFACVRYATRSRAASPGSHIVAPGYDR